VRIVSKLRIREAIEAHSEWKASLDAWWAIAKKADWSKFEDVRATLNKTDRVGKCVVFNIAGNKARMVAFINYEHRKIVILKIVSHEEYDKDVWKNECNCDQ
jgi:mRNA interferase HigB